MTKYSAREDICQFCKSRQVAHLNVKILHSGAEAFVWVCDGCDRFNPFGGNMWIDSDQVYRYLTKTEVLTLPVLSEPLTSRCAKCGSRGTELHHWAPKAVFGEDSDKWPQDYLCKPCHDEWHEKMSKNVLPLEQPV